MLKEYEKSLLDNMEYMVDKIYKYFGYKVKPYDNPGDTGKN